MSDLGRRVARWWRREIWEEPLKHASPLGATGRALLRAWAEAFRSFGSDQIEMRAHALTFRTLLSLVPLLAVAFSLFQAFGGLEAGEETLREALARNLAPGAAATAMEYVEGFVSRISAGAIGGTAVVFLFLTVVSLLSSMESSMNALWGIEKGRSFLSRFVVYWAMITVGPVLLALSLSMTSAGQSQAVLQRLDVAVPGTARVLLALVPWMFTGAGMTLVYVIVPNTHVRWRAALGGGLVAGTLWEIGKVAFTWASANLFRYNAIYGSFGTLPVFLLWLQVGWIVVLLGCKMTFVLQHSRGLRDERLQLEVGPEGRQFLALSCMIEIARAHQTGRRPPTLHDLLPGTRAALKAEKDVLGRLIDTGLLYSVSVPAHDGEGGDDGEEGYVPARDPALITPEEVVRALRLSGATAEDLDTGEPASTLARETLERADAEAAGVTASLSLADAARRLAGESGASEPRETVAP
jgi:membrane protein